MSSLTTAPRKGVLRGFTSRNLAPRFHPELMRVRTVTCRPRPLTAFHPGGARRGFQPCPATGHPVASPRPGPAPRLWPSAPARGRRRIGPVVKAAGDASLGVERAPPPGLASLMGGRLPVRPQRSLRRGTVLARQQGDGALRSGASPPETGGVRAGSERSAAEAPVPPKEGRSRRSADTGDAPLSARDSMRPPPTGRDTQEMR